MYSFLHLSGNEEKFTERNFSKNKYGTAQMLEYNRHNDKL